MIEGGLRCKGILKHDSDLVPLISYITVVYNRANVLEKCIQSIIFQENVNIEYIIIDGASSDGTLDVIRKYEDKIDYFISEKDSGIYNAMNKGLKLARGKLVCFMNSDDECLSGAAKTVTEYYLKYKADIICGDRILKQNGIEQNELLFKRFPIKHCCFRYLQMFHQSTYAAKMLFERIGGFDEQYALLGDWVWESKAIDSGAKICFINEKLSVFNNDGASFTGIAVRDAEWVRWIKSTFDFLPDRDAWFLLNCLDRDRHPFVLLSTIRKISDKYLIHKEFTKVIYETSLCMMLETLDDLKYKYCINNLDLNSFLRSYNNKTNGACEDITKTAFILTDLLNKSITDCSKDYSYDYCLLDKIRLFETKAYVNYLKNSIVKPNDFVELLIFCFRRSYLYFSYMCGKSVLMSKVFIKVIRNGQLLQFVHKILPINKWKKL